jgi:hypothetical protein
MILKEEIGQENGKKTILSTCYGMGVKNMHGDPNRVIELPFH